MKQMNPPRVATHSPFRELSLRDIVTPFFRRRRMIAIAFFAVFAVLIALAALMGPLFNSHMEILVNRERQDPLVTTEATTQMLPSSMPVTEDEINSEAELLLSSDVLQEVVLANGLDQQNGFSLTDWLHPNQTRDERVARAVRRLAKKIKIKPVAKADLIDARYISSSPQRSYSVLSSLAEVYMKKHIAVHRPTGSYDFFASETQRYQDQLRDAESKLGEFADHNGAAPEVQRTDLAQQVAASTGILYLAQQVQAADAQRVSSDRQQMGTMPDRSSTTRSTSAADLLLQNLNTALLAAQAKRTQLAMKYEPGYPLVQEAEREVDQAREAISAAEATRYVTETSDRDPTYELLREDQARAQSDAAAQRATATAAASSIASMKAEMVTLDKQALAQHDLQRDAKADEENYLLYLSKREQERTSDALDLKRIANVAIAVPPAIPVLPVFSWPQIVVIAFCAAFVLSIGAAYTIDYFDPSFHTPAQVVDMLGIPVVVAVAKKRA